MVRGLRYVERGLDGLVQLRDCGGVACTHQPLQSVAWNREYVVEVSDTPDGQPLPAAEHDFGREVANRSGDECDHNRTNAVKDGIPGEDYYGSATHRWGKWDSMRGRRLPAPERER